MGNVGSHSHHDDRQMPMMNPEFQSYPDMNVIFKGIPKMMQVADDMHILTQAITDMRNMTFGLGLITMVGMLLFVALKCMQGRRGNLRRRRRFHNVSHIIN
jgi:hypothetical protein